MTINRFGHSELDFYIRNSRAFKTRYGAILREIQKLTSELTTIKASLIEKHSHTSIQLMPKKVNSVGYFELSPRKDYYRIHLPSGKITHLEASHPINVFLNGNEITNSLPITYKKFDTLSFRPEDKAYRSEVYIDIIIEI